MIADESAPNKKYFIAASLEIGSFFKNPTNMYVGMLMSSQATKSITRSVEYATRTIPIAESKINEK